MLLNTLPLTDRPSFTAETGVFIYPWTKTCRSAEAGTRCDFGAESELYSFLSSPLGLWTEPLVWDSFHQNRLIRSFSPTILTLTLSIIHSLPTAHSELKNQSFFKWRWEQYEAGLERRGVLYLFIYYFYYIWKKCPLLSLRAAKRYSAGASWWIPPTVKRRTLLISLGFSNGPRALSLWQRVLPGVQSSVQQACGPPALSSPRQHSHAVYPHWFHVKQEVWWHDIYTYVYIPKL